MVQTLFQLNKQWSERRNRDDPGYFARLAAQQAPRYFWIGCSDSRVPANVVAGLDPGEVFVHRNVANVVHSADPNLLSALEFAVGALGVRQVIVCGHYGCGGVKAATQAFTGGLTDHWLAPIRRIARNMAEDLEKITDPAAREDRLAELNVIEGVRRVADTPIMTSAWARGEEVDVHGLIYGLSDGLLRDLGCSLTMADAQSGKSVGVS